MDHVVEAPDSERVEVTSESAPDFGRVTVTAELEPGQRLRLVKFVAYGWSSQRSLPAVRDQAGAALAAAMQTGWDGLLAEQRAYLDEFWDRRRRRGRGRRRAPAGGALRALPRAAGRAPGPSGGRSPAKGLTGPGYDGHSFWDTETFVLPVLTYTAPGGRGRRAALAALHAADGSQAGAAARSQGAAFPWRTINGEECSGLLAGRHRRVPHQRRHRRRGRPLPRRHPGTTRSTARSAWSCWSRRRGCGARSATTTRRAGSASTASPARTSTAPSRTTTSTPT